MKPPPRDVPRTYESLLRRMQPGRWYTARELTDRIGGDFRNVTYRLQAAYAHDRVDRGPNPEARHQYVWRRR